MSDKQDCLALGYRTPKWAAEILLQKRKQSTRCRFLGMMKSKLLLPAKFTSIVINTKAMISIHFASNWKRNKSSTTFDKTMPDEPSPGNRNNCTMTVSGFSLLTKTTQNDFFSLCGCGCEMSQEHQLAKLRLSFDKPQMKNCFCYIWRNLIVWNVRLFCGFWSRQLFSMCFFVILLLLPFFFVSWYQNHPAHQRKPRKVLSLRNQVGIE